MKKLLLIALIAGCAYLAYEGWVADQNASPPPEPKAVEAKPEPVGFVVKSRVRRLLDEWERRRLSASTGVAQGALAVEPALELAEIRKTLFADGVRSEGAVRDVLVRALRELGVAEKDISEVADGILAMR